MEYSIAPEGRAPGLLSGVNVIRRTCLDYLPPQEDNFYYAFHNCRLGSISAEEGKHLGQGGISRRLHFRKASPFSIAETSQLDILLKRTSPCIYRLSKDDET
jgi:hypothetical protein